MNINWNSPDFEGFAHQNPFAGKTPGEKKVRKPIGTPLTAESCSLVIPSSALRVLRRDT